MATIIDSDSSSDWDSADDLSEYSDTRVEDEDWERAEGDFTKHFNRLRQHVAVRTGNAQGSASALGKNSTVVAVPAINHPAAKTTTNALPRDRTSDQLAALAKYSSKIAKIDVPYTMGVGVNRKGPSSYANMKDRADRATTEQVLDPRTRTILLKMVGRGVIDEVNGCVSTGKEANVYHALTPDKAHLALKIYKTSILVFKDRDKYVSGEHRFRRGYSRHNPRKMVRLWAEKEMRNLKRLRAAGLRAPEPLEVRENVLVMSFLGSPEGWASPRLKDAELPAEAAAPLYEELLLAVRTLFHHCRLVHADLSEYNILYHEEHLYVIDVSQSVEHDHPAAFDFLRNDLKNVEEFFARRGVRCLGLRRAFEFVTRDQLPAVDLDDALPIPESTPVAADSTPAPAPATAAESDSAPPDATTSNPPTAADPPAVPPSTDPHALAVLRAWLHVADEEEDEEAHADGAQEDAVFLRAHITRSLNDVFDPERDAAALARGEDRGLVYADALGLVPREAVVGGGAEPDKGKGEGKGKGKVRFEAAEAGDDDERAGGEGDGGGDREEDGEDGSDDDEDGDGDTDAEDGEGDAFQERTPRGHRHEDRDAKKERKKAVKAEAKERRKHKMPKADKKRAVKKGK
ncbi:RIO1-domain-containing protein [Mycena albidolilacea]|uniref:Serine/threonine-protein kinase RIO1 n=1 Tax=Mycena albidolilacea TaxID=1033008 RepID=A0AAD7AS49_9AGAR|nr:RIO1-domain-containing protein [Mycena albidolilacea]